MSALDTDYGLAGWAERAPAVPAVIDPDGRVWSRAALDGLANRLGRALIGAGVEVGSVLAIVAPNCAQYLAAYFAGVRAGLRVVPVNWHLAPEELSYLLHDCEARAVLVHARLAANVLAAVCKSIDGATLRLSIGRSPGFVDIREAVAGCSGAALPVAALGRVMPYTSATTGRPKAVELPMRNAAAALARIVAWHRSLGIEPEAGNTHLCASMLYHCAPLEGAVTALRMGHRVVLSGHWRALRLLELIETFSVTTTFMVPTMFVRMLKLDPATRARYTVSSLRFVVHGGAPCPVEVKQRMLAWWGPIIWESYGAAEGQGTIVGPAEWLARPGTVGRPIPGSAVRIRDTAGRDCAAGVVGRVYLRPHTGDRFSYRGDPETTRACTDGEFVTVGDLGYLDEQGYLYLCERAAELILSSGMNIYPAEIEAVLVEHEAVVDCAVVGVPDPLFGQVPVAYVCAAAGHTPGSALALRLLDYLRVRLASMKLPRRIRFVERVPRDPSGKLFRRRLSISG